MRRQKTTAKVLCANKVGRDQVRVAVQVTVGKDIERVVIVDVDREVRRDHGGLPVRRTDLEMSNAAIQKALYPSLVENGTKVQMSAYDGGALNTVHVSKTDAEGARG